MMKLLDWFFGVSAAVFMTIIFFGPAVLLYGYFGILSASLYVWVMTCVAYLFWRIHKL